MAANDGERAAGAGTARGGETAPPAAGRVSLYRLFAFTDMTDAALMAVGAVAAVANGMAPPLMTFIFGDVINAFGSGGQIRRATQGHPESQEAKAFPGAGVPGWVAGAPACRCYGVEARGSRRGCWGGAAWRAPWRLGLSAPRGGTPGRRRAVVAAAWAGVFTLCSGLPPPHGFFSSVASLGLRAVGYGGAPDPPALAFLPQFA
ncbi:hypothetical protein U9M48_033620 [Paspalum notatum var. saurae]|uniref:Uncharacterized protein n=1 Tax=Paspalum notatum var. saurae TaxID=547442 RepID=A0AAQ3X6V9_PASNO